MTARDNEEAECALPRPDEYLNTAQAAYALNIAPGTLQNWRSLGIGPKFIKHRRRVIYLKTEIQAYLRTHFRLYRSTAEWRDR